jgi:hypothetical protein
VQEREVIAIRALLLLGRDAEAKARAERFHRRYPDSVLSPTPQRSDNIRALTPSRD